MTPIHRELAAGRWHTMPLVDQMANVGSEVERTIRARERGDEERFDRALDRALELFDLTLADPRWRGPRLREIARAREEFCTLFFGGDMVAEPERVRKYYLQFALLARRGR